MKKLIWAFIFFLSAANINADNLKFGWNIGNFGFYYDALSNAFNGDLEIGHFNWLFANKYSIGFNLLRLSILDLNKIENIRYSIIPLEIAFVPINYKDWLFASIYGKTGFESIEVIDSNRFNKGIFGLVGINFFMFPQLKFGYSPYFSTFIEYNTHNELKFGMRLDLFSIFYFGLLAYKKDKEKEYNPKITRSD